MDKKIECCIGLCRLSMIFVTADLLLICISIVVIIGRVFWNDVEWRE